MLRSVKSFLGFSLLATDGDIGKVDDLLFNDDHWTTAYLVVNTGRWLSGRRVLLPPAALGSPSWKERTFPVALKKEQVRNSPGVDLDQPVSRQYEIELHEHYGWMPYWLPGGSYSMGTVPLAHPLPEAPIEEEKEQKGDPHLRSVNEVTGYHIIATDGGIGHVKDFIVDDTRWTIRYLVVDTATWFLGRQVIISPNWIRSIDWGDDSVHIDFTKEEVKGSPEYDPSIPVNREYESRLYDYYGRPATWIEERKE